MAASALIGQNLGKSRPDIAALFGKTGQRIGFFCSVFLASIFVFFGKYILRLFLVAGDPNYDYILQTGRYILIIMAVITMGQISQVIFTGALRGAGDTKYVAVTSAISIMVIRPILTYLLCFTCGFGIYGAWFSMLVDQFFRLFLGGRRFRKGKWAKIEI